MHTTLLKKLGVLLATGLLSSAAIAQSIDAKFAVTLPKTSHQALGVAKFIDLVKEKSDGRIKIRPYYNAALGNDVQVTSALQGGTIEFTVPQTSTLTGMVREFEILDYPFLFANEQEADTILDGPIGQRLLDQLPAKGLVGLAYWENGFFNATNSKHPITKPEDFEGLKFRAVQAKISQETLKALGANPVSLAVPEIYTALETRTIDGQGTPTAVTASLKLGEVQKYLSLTKHSYGAFLPLASQKFWDKLSEADQQIIKEAAEETRIYQREIARQQASEAQAALAEQGLEVNEVSDAEMMRFREKMQPVWESFNAEIGPEFAAETFAEIEKLRTN